MDVAGKPALCPSLKDAREGSATVRTNKPSRRERVMRKHNDSERKSAGSACCSHSVPRSQERRKLLRDFSFFWYLFGVNVLGL